MKLRRQQRPLRGGLVNRPADKLFERPHRRHRHGLNQSADLNQLLRFIRDEHGVSVLLIEHDMGVVMEISDHIVVLDYGEKIADGTAEVVRSDPRVIAAYLGVEDVEVAVVAKEVGL